MSKTPSVVLGDKPFFPSIEQPISFEGRTSDNPMAFKFYDADRMIGTKKMRLQQINDIIENAIKTA